MRLLIPGSTTVCTMLGTHTTQNVGTTSYARRLWSGESVPKSDDELTSNNRRHLTIFRQSKMTLRRRSTDANVIHTTQLLICIRIYFLVIKLILQEPNKCQNVAAVLTIAKF